MKHIPAWLAILAFYICAPALADDAVRDPFQDVAAAYMAANPKPVVPDEARKLREQANSFIQEARFDKALQLYDKALEVAPWWPEVRYTRAIVLGETKNYVDAIREMKRYMRLVSNAGDTRKAQDNIDRWETMVRPKPTASVCTGCPAMVPIPEKGYEIGKYEVTQGEWRAVMGNNPSKFSNCGDTCPVEQVSWNDVQEFIQKLNARTGRQYRLPSDGEWGYACYNGYRGGQTRYCGGDDLDAVAWYGGFLGGNSNNQSHPVGQKKANDYGLYDMSGNVWEWTSDCWENDCAYRVLRGGSWDLEPRGEGAVARIRGEPTDRYQFIGFRLARTLP